MKSVTLSLMVAAFLCMADQAAFGQQDCNCNQGETMPDSIYEPAQWNTCESCDAQGNHRMSRLQARRHHKQRGSRLASLWTRPLFPRSYAARCCASKGFPDAGWNPPAHMPVNYDGAWYGSYLPQNAYGTPGGGFIANYPTVYQPTDTAQLGYYYHKVPTWQSRSDMIPTAPSPGSFHARFQPTGGCGYRPSYPVSYAPVSAACQTCNSGY